MKKRTTPDKDFAGGVINSLTRFFELPKEIMLDLPLVSLIGRQEVTVENFKGVLEYSGERVKINTTCGAIKIEGRNLEILEITSESAVVTGVIIRLEYND